jgi:integrase
MPRPATVVPLLGWRPATAGQFAAQGLPLQELWTTVTRFVWERPGVRTKTLANRRRSAELSRALPAHPTPADVMAWLVSLDGQFSPGTVENHRKALAALYAYGAKLGVSTGNPAALCPARRVEGKPSPIQGIGEWWPRFLAVAADDRERALLGVFRFTGLRRGEVLGLRRSDVLQLGDAWRLNVVRQRPDPQRLDHTPPKTAASCRELPVRPPLRALLAPLLDADPEVRRGHGGARVERVDLLFPYREEALADLMRRLREVAPPGAFPPGSKAWHALRDTLAAEMRQAGKTVSQVSEALGHTSEYVTRTHYLSTFGRAVPADGFAGLDPPESRAPRRTAAPKSEPPALPGASGSRRSKQGGPTTRKESTTCSATAAAKGRSQRALPGLSVGPVVTRKPRRRA